MTEILEHFVWRRVDRRGNDECWPWLGGTNKRSGNGVAYVGHGNSMAAHRAVYMLLVGPIPDGLVLDHVAERCGNPSCVNPGHLEPVTQLENVRRGRAGAASRERCAAVTHCPKGHEYTPENTKVDRLVNGYTARTCRECARERNRAWKRRRRDAAAAIDNLLVSS